MNNLIGILEKAEKQVLFNNEEKIKINNIKKRLAKINFNERR